MATFPAEVTELSLFPTKFLSFQFSDVEQLNDDLYRLFATHPDFQIDDFNKRSNYFDLLGLAGAHPCIARVRDMFLDGLKRWMQSEKIAGEFLVDSFLFPNYARRHEFTIAHNHGADVVGVYYVKTAEQPEPLFRSAHDDFSDYWSQDNGVLLLHDPRFNANLVSLTHDDYLKVYPRAGLMVIFPAYVWHSVTPHRDDFRRLSIAANFAIGRKKPLVPPHVTPLRVERAAPGG
jgi:hypothetical protein